MQTAACVNLWTSVNFTFDNLLANQRDAASIPADSPNNLSKVYVNRFDMKYISKPLKVESCVISKSSLKKPL